MNKIEKIVSFYVLTNSLKEKIRSGWIKWNISAKRLESVAEHIYGTCMLAIAIDSEYDLNIDIKKVVLMLTIHELEEIKIGDLTPFDKITLEEKREMGKKAVKEVLNGLVKEEEYYNLIQEFDDFITNEAIFARMCDKLEADLQCKIYTERRVADINKIECQSLLQDERIIKLMDNGANKLSDLFIGFNMPIYVKEEFKKIAKYIKDNNIIKGEYSMSELISEEIRYEGPRFNVVRKVFKNEKMEYIRDIAQTKDAVVVVPVTENNEIIFVRQTREVVGEETLELPAGVIEEGEDIQLAGLRELKEETGYIANNVEFLTEAYASCGFTNEKLYYYVAKDLILDKQELDEDESISEVIKIPVEKAIQMLKNNELKTASANIGLSHYYLKYMN